MSFKDSERSRPVAQGVVIHPDIADSVAEYFRDHSIAWWGGTGSPPENPVSSQVACVNHLGPARQDEALALAVAQSVVPGAEAVLPVEGGGFVAYEWIGERNYLGERSHTRGANSTSLDALMAVEVDKRVELILIEWKYTESYKAGRSRAVSEKGTDRVAIYRDLLERSDCPIAVPRDQPDVLFYYPIEQLMRQTLLGWQMTEAHEFAADDWHHVVVVPDGNTALRQTNPSPELSGDSLLEAWQGVLVDPSRFSIHSPTSLMSGFTPSDRWDGWRGWLHERYGT